ncbi:MAG TPA: SRPBCC family protein [Anaerolineae bacterium]|nr:SRPBCC family protein [Anaerolineae bacterium]
MWSAQLIIQADIPAPPDTLFAYISDLTRHGEWAANQLTITPIIPGPVVQGSIYNSHAQVKNLEFHSKLQVTTYDPPRHFAFTGEDKTGRFEHHFTLHPHQKGTELTRRINFDLTFSQWLFFKLTYYPVRLPAAREAMNRLTQHFQS